MADKLIISFNEYTKIVEKLALLIHKNYKPTVLVGIMRGAAPIIDILSRILKLPIAYIVIQSYSGKGMEDKQGDLMFAREISSLANNEDFNRVLLIDDLSDTGLTLNKSIEWLKNYGPTKEFIKEIKTACLWKKNHLLLSQIFVRSSLTQILGLFSLLNIMRNYPLRKLKNKLNRAKINQPYFIIYLSNNKADKT